MALVAHTISIDDKFFEYANKWLHSKTLTTILCCIYNLDGPTSFTEIELNYALTRREERYQNAFGIDGINQPFHESTCNIFSYEYEQEDDTRQYFYYIKSNTNRGGASTWSSHPKDTPIAVPISQPSLQQEHRRSRCNPRPRNWSDENSEGERSPHDMVEEGDNVTQPQVDAEWFKERNINEMNVGYGGSQRIMHDSKLLQMCLGKFTSGGL